MDAKIPPKQAIVRVSWEYYDSRFEAKPALGKNRFPGGAR
jgi:hypothetical protein